MQSASIDCGIADLSLLQALIGYHRTVELAHFVYSQSCDTSFLATFRVHHGYTPGYWRQTRTRTRDGSVPAPRVRVWSRVPSLVPVPVPAAGIPVGDEQGGRAKVRATQATAQHA